MNIEHAHHKDKKAWNEFVREHYPPVGAFIQTWEWGLFQERLGRTIGRYFVLDKGAPIALFTLIHHTLPLGLKYGYIARGPAIAVSHVQRTGEIFQFMRKWAIGAFPRHLFLRLEPPIPKPPEDLSPLEFQFPEYYIQPRYNMVVLLDRSEEEILKSFHPSTRSNVSRAEKRGVTVKIRTDITTHEFNTFNEMIQDTTARTRSSNAYPSRAYFDALFSVLSQANQTAQNPHNLSLEVFYGYHNGEPAATHFVLFFGTTATYLYGASYTRHLNSKVTTYLHWAAMQEARRRGMKYYDIGAIDKGRWKSLTEFKLQFRGKEFEYMGNIDIPIRPLGYRLYKLLRKLRIRK